MRKQLIPFAQVMKFLQNIKLKGGRLNPTPLRTPLIMTGNFGKFIIFDAVLSVVVMNRGAVVKNVKKVIIENLYFSLIYFGHWDISYDQLPARRSLINAFCRRSWGERSCQRSAMAIHSVEHHTFQFRGMHSITELFAAHWDVRFIVP